MPRPASSSRSFALPSVIVLFATVFMLPTVAQPPAKSPSATAATTRDATPPAKTSGAADALLPETFAGWELSGAPQISNNPRAADDANAAVLGEYGFTRFAGARYTRDSGTVDIKAIEFGDATGAFGAFTFYRRPRMLPQTVGQGGAFDGSHVLFWQGTVLVDAKFSKLTAMSVAELRDLATELPKPTGNQGTLPTLPSYLPPQHLELKTLQYAVGPIAYRQSGGVLPAALVDFNRSAEVVTAQYNALSGYGTLTIINYPTPEIAMDREKAIRAYFAGHASGKVTDGQSNWTSALTDSNPDAIQTRRSGPLVAVTSGSFSGESAQQVLQRVHYEVNLTMSNGTGYRSDSSTVAQIILDVAFMVGVFAVIAIVSAVSLGGGRIAWSKMRGKKGLPTEESAEFIRLNLKD
ncbi:MAG: DUF6599 family protein [Acidobacteriaceae bacterium]